MRKLTLSILASAAVLSAVPAMSAVTLAPINGPNLDTAIKASTTNTLNDQTVVFGSTQNNGQSANVTFTGNTAIHITDGAGYASISDAGGPANFTQLLIDPTPNFTALQFSVALQDAGFVFVEYLLAAPGSVFSSVLTGTNPFAQAANTNKDYQITATGTDVFSAIRITTCTTAAGCTAAGSTGTGTGISLEKQNSITLASVTSPVPEPATWAMMLVGFGAAGVSLRRRKRVTALQAA